MILKYIQYWICTRCCGGIGKFFLGGRHGRAMMVVEQGQWLWFFSDGLGTNLVTLDLHDQLNSIFKNACWSTLAWFDSNSSIFIKQQLHSITTSSDLEYAEYASYASFVSFCLRGAVASSTCVSTSAGPDLSTFKNLAPFLCDIHVETSVQGKQFLLKQLPFSSLQRLFCVALPVQNWLLRRKLH